MPGFWAAFSVLGLVFVVAAVALTRAALTEPAVLGIERAGALGRALFWAVLAGQLALGAVMLRSVWTSVRDYRSATVTVTRVTIREHGTTRQGQFLRFTDEGGRRGSVRVSPLWEVRRLPQRADLWRTRHGEEPLRLVLHDERRSYSVLDARP